MIRSLVSGDADKIVLYSIYPVRKEDNSTGSIIHYKDSQARNFRVINLLSISQAFLSKLRTAETFVKKEKKSMLNHGFIINIDICR